MFLHLFTFVAICLSVQAVTAASLSRKTRQANGSESDGDCSLPDFPSNGLYTVVDSSNDTSPGDSVGLYTLLEYSCLEGFSIIENSSVCQEDGTWSTSPKCEANNNNPGEGCPLPQFPTNGWYTVPEYDKKIVPGDTVGLYSVLEYACEKNFDPTVTSSLCLDDGTWSSSPECKTETASEIGSIVSNTDVRCSLPQLPTNGWYTVSEYDKKIVPGDTVGLYSVLEYACEKNFDLTVPRSLCQEDGTWNSSPECKTQTASEIGSIESNTGVGCSLPEFPTNGWYTVSEYDKKIVPGDTVGLYSVLEYACEKNFDLTVPRSLCQEDGTWNSSPECKTQTASEIESIESTDKVCVLPQFPTNGWYTAMESDRKMVLGDAVGLYTVLRYSCEKNFDLTVADSLCQNDGTWSSSPECKIRAASSSAIDSAGGCPLLEFPYKGRYTVMNIKNKKIFFGDIVEPYTILQYTCNKKYDLTDRFSQCLPNGTWTVLPECTSRCKMVTSFTVDFVCSTPAGAARACSPTMPRGSIVRARCKDGHFPTDPTDILGALVCEDGRWSNPVPKCKPECGLETPEGVTHIINGFTAKKYSFPWHVAIYRDDGEQNLDQICGGSLIQSHIVLSAAHCFYDPHRNVAFPPRYYRVSGGNFYRSWDHQLERGRQAIQKSEVSKIRLPDRYGGDRQLHQSDVALLVLATPFKISDSVRPVCYDFLFENDDSFQLTPGNLGKVAGWGLTGEAGVPSEELKTISLPVIGYKDCLQELSKYHFSGYITTDKFCAGYLNGSAVCHGDSGGGLVFPVMEVSTQTRWYVRGVVSTGPLNDDKSGCRADSYTAFTHLFKLRDWLNQELRELM